MYHTFNHQPIIFNSCSFLIQPCFSGSAALAVERRRFRPTINMSVSYRWSFSAVSCQISKEGNIYKILEVKSYINYKLQLHLSRTRSLTVELVLGPSHFAWWLVGLWTSGTASSWDPLTRASGWRGTRCTARRTSALSTALSPTKRELIGRLQL